MSDNNSWLKNFLNHKINNNNIIIIIIIQKASKRNTWVENMLASRDNFYITQSQLTIFGPEVFEIAIIIL